MDAIVSKAELVSIMLGRRHHIPYEQHRRTGSQTWFSHGAEVLGGTDCPVRVRRDVRWRGAKADPRQTLETFFPFVDVNFV